MPTYNLTNPLTLTVWLVHKNILIIPDNLIFLSCHLFCGYVQQYFHFGSVWLLTSCPYYLEVIDIIVLFHFADSQPSSWPLSRYIVTLLNLVTQKKLWLSCWEWEYARLFWCCSADYWDLLFLDSIRSCFGLLLGHFCYITSWSCCLLLCCCCVCCCVT